MQNVTLTFTGGPLDGELRRRVVRDDWTVVRFAEPSETDPHLRHVYAGARLSSAQAEIPMRYLGLTKVGEEYAT
jgi:hypothetical protein